MVTDVADLAEAIGQLYCDRVDCENGVDGMMSR